MKTGATPSWRTQAVITMGMVESARKEVKIDAPVTRNSVITDMRRDSSRMVLRFFQLRLLVNKA